MNLPNGDEVTRWADFVSGGWGSRLNRLQTGVGTNTCAETIVTFLWGVDRWSTKRRLLVTGPSVLVEFTTTWYWIIRRNCVQHPQLFAVEWTGKLGQSGTICISCWHQHSRSVVHYINTCDLKLLHSQSRAESHSIPKFSFNSLPSKMKSVHGLVVFLVLCCDLCAALKFFKYPLAVVSTSTVTTTSTFVTLTRRASYCAKLVNVTAVCRRKRGMWIDEPEVMSFDGDSESIDEILRPSKVRS